MNIILSMDSLTLSHHPSLSDIALSKSSRRHPVSTQSCPSENITNKFVLISPVVPCMSCLTYLDGLWNRR